jgi:hypothetical protein
MKKIILLTLIPFTSFSQSVDCEGLISETENAFVFGVNRPLEPDPCGAKPPYDYGAVLTVSPEAGKTVEYKKVIIKTETTVDHECNVETVELERDTIVTHTDVIMGERTGIMVGGKYVVQCELMREAPSNRPKGFMSTLLPDENKYGGYWVVHYGEYSTKENADAALRRLKTDYPEYCSAFIRKLPSNCEFRYEYKKRLD